MNDQANNEGQLSWTDSSGTAHEACKLLFFAGKAFFGEAAYDPGDAPELGYRRGGVAFFCLHCGEIWGRVVCITSLGQTTAFAEIVKVSCERHYDQWEIAGSFLSGYRNEGYLKYLSKAAVEREFLIHLRHLGEET